METLADTGMNLIQNIYFMLACGLGMGVGVVIQILPYRPLSILARIRNVLAVTMGMVIGLTIAFCLLLALLASLYDKYYFFGVPITFNYMANSLLLSLTGLLLNRFWGRKRRQQLAIKELGSSGPVD